MRDDAVSLSGEANAEPASAAGRGVLAVAATFTIDGIESSLRFMLDEAGLDLDVRFAPYNQVFQELLTPTGLLGSRSGGVNVVVVRLEDYLRDRPAQAVPDAAFIENTVGELLAALRQHAGRARSPTLLWALSPSPAASASSREIVQQATDRLLDGAARVSGVHCWGSATIDRLCEGASYDRLSDELAHIPYTDPYLASLAIAVTRKAHALLMPAAKVLVLDCDNTIWKGVVGEEGPLGIEITPAARRVQEFAVKAQANGTLICLASKNTEADVFEVFASRSDMALQADHVVAHRINWESKPGNVRSLARALNLGLDAFVFLDDNPVECAQMRSELPQVITLQTPEDEAVGAFLENLWCFDKLAVTDEDLRRTSLYRENAARESMEESAGDIGAFLAALELVIEIEPPQEPDWPRLAQLTQRTNQFNFTTRRRSEAELRAMHAAGTVVLAVRVRDRFGDYGLVGLVVAANANEALAVDTLLLSCRVLGRGVEHAILRRLGELAFGRGLATVDLPYVRTPKNEPARAFANSVALAYEVASGATSSYRMPTAMARALAHRPGEDPEAVVEARRAEAKKVGAPTVAAAAADRSARYAQLALAWTSGARIVQASRSRRLRSRDADSPLATVPATDNEALVLGIFEEVLEIAGLGVEDGFFDAGGSSLQAARLFAEVARRSGVSLPLTTIIEAPTARALALRLSGQAVRHPAGVVALRPGAQGHLFLVHDGDGETLLYRNLAHRLPPGLGVYGIQPRSAPRIPMAHTDIAAMAHTYVEVVRQIQPHGPYLLGGMCAGGVIAVEMARVLTDAGEPVDLVAILDAATPQAQLRGGSLMVGRVQRLRQAMAQAEAGAAPWARLIAAARLAGRKVSAAFAYDTRRIVTGWSVKARFSLLQRVLVRRRAWPTWLPALSVRDIYERAESRHVPTSGLRVPGLLIRARAGDGNDTAYVHRYADSTLGWEAVVDELVVADVEGGHASMLQEPHVASLAAELTRHLGVAASRRSQGRPR